MTIWLVLNKAIVKWFRQLPNQPLMNILWLCIPHILLGCLQFVIVGRLFDISHNITPRINNNVQNWCPIWQVPSQLGRNRSLADAIRFCRINDPVTFCLSAAFHTLIITIDAADSDILETWFQHPPCVSLFRVIKPQWCVKICQF